MLNYHLSLTNIRQMLNDLFLLKKRTRLKNSIEFWNVIRYIKERDDVKISKCFFSYENLSTKVCQQSFFEVFIRDTQFKVPHRLITICACGTPNSEPRFERKKLDLSSKKSYPNRVPKFSIDRMMSIPSMTSPNTTYS